MGNAQSTASPIPAAPLSRKQWLAFAAVMIPFALAHFVSYLYRTVNAVIYPDLAHDLNLAASSIGLLTGAYFFAFALAQLPVGVALDRFGPRRVQVPMLLLAACGAGLFAYAHSLLELVAARALIGLGVAGSLMAAIKACSLWLPQERLPFYTALLLSVGGMGAMASSAPMHAVLQYTSWRIAFMGLGLCTLAVSAMIFIVVPEHPKKQNARFVEMISAVRQIYVSGAFWKLALYSLFAHATYMAVQGLWMGAYLRDMAHLNRADVAGVLLTSTVAMVAGSLFFGWITDYARKFGFKPILICGAGITLFVLFQFLMVFATDISPYFVAIGFSFCGTATTMNYAIVAQSLPPNLTGRVSASFNLLAFLLAFIVQWGIGAIINIWPADSGIYPQIAYRYAFGINLALQIPGLLLWSTFRPLQKISAK